MEQMVYFYAKLGMMKYQVIIRFILSTVAGSAVYVALKAHNKPLCDIKHLKCTQRL